jgi:outer membrane receptor for ferrienterochelin and colicins
MKTILSICLFILSTLITFSTTTKTDAHLIGHVLNGGEHIPFANVVLKGTTIGTSTDETGHYRMINLPEGNFTVVAMAVGYKPVEKQVEIKAGQTIELNFKMEEDAIGLDELVVTGDRNAQRKKESSVVVNTINSRVFTMTNSVTLGDGLNFSPGLRMENNCQNCGFTQLRMNGLEGPYSQILINSRPIFSGLAGVYGLELIPSNMIERVEVIKGGGSALYGSNAIAGTVNLILRDPINNSYEISLNSGLTGIGVKGSGGFIPDNTATFNTTAVSSDLKTGLAVYGFVRNRKPFDANDDGFSELSSLENTSVGARVFHRFGHRSKLSGDFFNIQEKRRGGDRHDYPLHEAFIAEAVEHSINTSALTYDQFFRERDLLSVFVSAQHVNRDSYYGADQSLNSYGNTTDLTYTAGAQYKMQIKEQGLIFGIENQGGHLLDKKLGYSEFLPDNGTIDTVQYPNTIVANQTINITGAFSQIDYAWGKFKTTAGLRFDHYRISDAESNLNNISGNVLSPRVTLMYDLGRVTQLRASYAMGYRAPQIFDEDLHLETSGSRKVIHKNAPGLKQETSHSFMASVDFLKQNASNTTNLLVEGFYTILNNPFANEYGEPDANGEVIYTRVNANEGALVMGVNTELTLARGNDFSFRTGLTLQNSRYMEVQEFEENRFLRTPSTYGFFTAEWTPTRKLGISTTGTYTGKMLVPYFGLTLPDPEEGELRKTNPFLELSAQLRYDVKVNGATLRLFAGVKNILNAYQKDFDSGKFRDPGYMYGPNQPRSLYFGLKLGNNIR